MAMCARCPSSSIRLLLLVLLGGAACSDDGSPQRPAVNADAAGAEDASSSDRDASIRMDDASVCSASTTLCGQGCVDTEVDASNCGACEHDCLGGTCSEGRCSPVELADQLEFVTELAIGADGAFAGGHDTNAFGVPLVRIPFTGGSPVTLAEDVNAEQLGIRDGYLYVGDSLIGLQRMLLGGGELDLYSSTDCGIFAFDADGWFCTISSNLADIVRIADNGVGTPIVRREFFPQMLAIDSDRVYWGTYGNGGISAVPREGGEKVLLTPAQDTVAIAVDEQFVYFVGADGRVSKVAKTGGMALDLHVERAPEPVDASLAMDATHLYVALRTPDPFDPPAGTVLRVAKDGSSVEVLAQVAQEVRAVAVDEQRVYWATWAASGTLFALAK
jgi:hypothetical protein